MRHLRLLGGAAVVAVLLTSCLCDGGSSDGIASVGVVDGRLVAYEAEDDFELGYVVPAGYGSTDLGVSWPALSETELPAYDALPAREGRGYTSVYEPAEWCGSTGSYVVDDLSLTERNGGEML